MKILISLILLFSVNSFAGLTDLEIGNYELFKVSDSPPSGDIVIRLKTFQVGYGHSIIITLGLGNGTEEVSADCLGSYASNQALLETKVICDFSAFFGSGSGLLPITIDLNEVDPELLYTPKEKGAKMKIHLGALINQDNSYSNYLVKYVIKE